MDLSLKKILLIAVVATLFVFFYKRASGSLSIKKLNAINFSFYILLITSLFGGTLIYLGFKNHYTAAIIQESSARKGYYILSYSIVSLPIFILLFNRLMGIRNYGQFFDEYIERETVNIWEQENTIFALVFLTTVVCAAAVAYTLYHVGFIALIELLRGRVYLLQLGASITRKFSGNTYVRNIIAIGMTPILSYIAYIYYYYTKQMKWRLLFWVLLILSILMKTYDFSKAPVVMYLLYFYLIRVLMGEKVKLHVIVRYGFGAAVLMIGIYYIIAGYRGDLFNLTNGPIARLMITQIAGLFLHVQLFPKQLPYLHGASFPKSIGLLLGSTRYGIRSARQVMITLWPESAETSGVMNTLFSAEAYANYGMTGVIISPIIVAFCFSVILNFILKQKKTPITISIYILYTYCYIQALMGGYVDFFYNASLIILTVALLLIASLANGGRVSLRL